MYNILDWSLYLINIALLNLKEEFMTRIQWFKFDKNPFSKNTHKTFYRADA